eukprot:NODE_1417_length_544_cov_100.351515_g1340_i0.p1 GENE.NODE_1417_length_544_cov_100.351515_g1340_i0~~NODE_1417_length_544_cov_100.351515_g1340_i0.p1  ORF type:complete len:134 (+),score=41.16 NODE_1417_length_544_cov_100.351515_g1340_i0:25-402(+)
MGEETAFIIEIEDTPSHNMSKCTRVHIDNAPPKDPCFTQNGTHTHTDKIGGSLEVLNFFAEDHPDNRTPMFQHIQLVPINGPTGAIYGIPVKISYWNSFDHGEVIYKNYNTTFPVGIWTVPGICN